MTTVEKPACMTIDQLINRLEEAKKELGGHAEVTVANEADECFDGIGNLFHVVVVSTKEKIVVLLRNDVMIKP